MFHKRAILLIFETEVTELYYELKLRSSEDSSLVLLKGMASNLRVYNSSICHVKVLSLVDGSLHEEGPFTFRFHAFCTKRTNASGCV